MNFHNFKQRAIDSGSYDIAGGCRKSLGGGSALAFSNKLFQGTEQNKEEKPYWSSLAN